MGKVLEALDHPIPFSFFIALTTAFWFLVLKWLFTAVNQPAIAAVF